METFEVHNAGTRYIAHVSRTGPDQYICIVTKASGNAGQWIVLPGDFALVSWSYLTEKMPALAQYGGDYPGYVKLFAEIGIRIFGGDA